MNDEQRSQAGCTGVQIGTVIPGRVLTAHLDATGVSQLRSAVAEFQPDLIWAENFTPAALAVCAADARSVIYSHHDWVWRVWTHASRRKGRTWRSRLRCWFMRRAEEALTREAGGVVSPSATEAAQLRQFNTRVAYLPPAYEIADLNGSRIPMGTPRVVHVGGMATTSNHLGLERFLDVSWPLTRAAGQRAPELWVIGDLGKASASLRHGLANSHCVCTGFVEDLSTVLRPYDLHIVPWEHDTGTRTKIPLALNYAQVVVATRMTARCLPELVEGENCVLVDTLEEMGRAIPQLLLDGRRRRQLGEAGRRTFLEHYTYGALQARFDRVIEDWKGRSLAPPPAAQGLLGE